LPLDAGHVIVRQTHKGDQMIAQRIGFVGIGNMGAPMVRCLVKAGHRVTAFDADQSKAKAVAAEHPAITAAPSLKVVAADCRLIITMLPDSSIVRRAVLGDGDNLAAGLAEGTLIVDMSSSFAPDTVKLGSALKARGAALIDAPVSGGVGKAVSGTLAIMTGGSDADIQRATPALSAMGTVHRTGQLGSGHALKALNNYVSAAGLIATCEALIIGKAFGLDPTTAVKVINASTGRNNTTENKADRYLIPERYDSGFALALMNKDVGMAHDLAAQMGIAADELAFVTAYLKRAASRLGPDVDHTAVMAFAQRPD
jgi:3-hydroxyisobutyrate dehydrogenase